MLARPSDARAFYALIHSLPEQLDLSLLIASEEVSALRGAGRVMSLDNGRLHSTDSRRKVISFPQRRGAA